VCLVCREFALTENLIHYPMAPLRFRYVQTEKIEDLVTGSFQEFPEGFGPCMVV